MKKILVVSLAVVLLLSILVIGCGKKEATTATPTTTTTAAQPTPTAAATPKLGGTLRVIYPYMGTSLGWPATSRGGYSMYQALCLEPLLEQLMDGTILPRLATDYKIGDDNSITFTLRQGVTFHDGTPFNAAAVKFNFDALKDAKVGDTINWASVDVIDDSHIKVTYSNWSNWAISDFTYSGAMYIVSPTAYQKNGLDWMKNNMVGTGPFVQTDWEQDVAVKFDKNPNYWQKGKPYIEKLEALCVADAVTAQTTILAGGADILNSEADQKVVDMKAKGLSAVTRPVGVINFFPDSANAESPLSIQALREAIEYALDKDAMSKTLCGGLLSPAYQMAPPNVSAYNPNITGRKYDPNKAKQLMADAGYPNGFSFTLIPCPVPMFNDSAVAIQASLAKVGIKADVQMITDAKFGDYIFGDWHDTAVLAAVSSCVPNWSQALSGFFNPKGTLFKPMARSDAFAAAFNAAAYTKDYDISKVQALLKEMYDEEMVIPVFNAAEAWIYQPYVKDAWAVWPAGLQMWTPENTWLDK